jgi:hypothetical protein
VTLNNIFRMANIDFWIQRPLNRVKWYVGLNTNKMPLDSLNDDFFQKSDLTNIHMASMNYFLIILCLLYLVKIPKG